MVKYVVKIVKDKRKNEKDFPNDSGFRYSFNTFEKNISHPNLESLSQDQITQILQDFFRRVNRKNVDTTVEFNKKERVIINEVGDYGFDKAVYDKETRIPKHLRKPLGVKKDG